MAREDLRPFQTSEEARRKGAIGGKKSGESRRRKKLLRETLEEYLKAKPDGQKTVQQGITEALVERALNGDTKAYELIRDTIGQKPIDKQQQNVDAEIRVRWMS